ncbi:PIG-L family deacetylase [Maribacter sp. PR1]|uniref:PIG-L family deacetylase n=1 Tax=Maribacter cobaltidurans TaxID=1178778 RepID=A0ABU7IWQ7_9FLAO|nr:MULTISPECIES: PIG-L family deacetylase [Maribacter]MDC6389639.1 PIG-L family deacetylase [Maribacter sp. PR1]MEE1977028.1 PIG-L family deacetylase [Maribacter cobaltidurans]
MKTMKVSIFSYLIFTSLIAFAQPKEAVENWKGKKVLLIGAHPDDDHQSHGTLAMLNKNGNEIYILTMSTGNVGTKDTKLGKDDLAKIRRIEQLDAMKQIGLSEDRYINLGYDDGRLEFANKEEAIGKLVYYIRKLKPDVLMAFDPGYNYQVWHKSDHRAAAYLAADAVRAAEWPLMYEGHIIQDKLEAHVIPEFLFYGGNVSDKNTIVDITDFVDQRVNAGSKYVSQWTSGWNNYLGHDIENYPAAEKEKLFNKIKGRIKVIDGKFVERFRYHQGAPDSMGHGPRD